MQHSIFISDLHLCPTRPAISQTFFDFLRGPAARAEALYILGDLFEYWAGDDDNDPFNASVLAALRDLAHTGIKLFLMHGNRDFLIGDRFAADTGARLLPDPTLLDLYGTRTLLMHGDTLCTDDVGYQEFRAKVRNPEYQRQFLAQPLLSRKQIIAGLRTENTEKKQSKSKSIMATRTARNTARKPVSRRNDGFVSAAGNNAATSPANICATMKATTHDASARISRTRPWMTLNRTEIPIIAITA